MPGMKTDPAVLKYCCTLKYYCDGIFLYIWPQTAPTPEKPALPATALSAEIPVLYRTGPGGGGEGRYSSGLRVC